jgi:hypothetical protein
MRVVQFVEPDTRVPGADVDGARLRTSHLATTAVRRIELDTLVGTGAVMILLPQDVVETLGLPLDGKIVVALADESKVELARAFSR